MCEPTIMYQANEETKTVFVARRRRLTPGPTGKAFTMTAALLTSTRVLLGPSTELLHNSRLINGTNFMPRFKTHTVV